MRIDKARALQLRDGVKHHHRHKKVQKPLKRAHLIFGTQVAADLDAHDKRKQQTDRQYFQVNYRKLRG